MRKLAAILPFCTMLLARQANAAGIPVFDAANVAQAISSVTQLKAQLDQQKQIFQSMNGARGMGQLLNNPALRNYLPADWQKVYDGLAQGGYSGLTGSAMAILKANGLNCTAFNSTQRALCERQAGKDAQDKAFGLDAYEQANRRIDQIEGLMNQINQTGDPKAIAELNARIQAENALIQNEQIKLQMFTQLSQAEDKLIRQQQKQRAYEEATKPDSTVYKLKRY